MTELGAVPEQLKQERERAEGELRKLEEVIAALGKITGHSPRSSRFGNRAKHRLSAAARERSSAKSALGEGAGQGEEVCPTLYNRCSGRRGQFRPLSFFPTPNFSHAAVRRFLE